MAQPASKKQKTDDEVLASPIVFQSPGLQPDVRLTVFDVEFHVHSVVLKLHSAFFRKFLDSLDKTPPSSIDSGAFSKFKYDWVTAVDKDAGADEKNIWHLVDSRKSKERNDLSALKGVKKRERDSFERLLCAAYSRPYTIKSMGDLKRMSALADYYRMLPILSISLDRALLSSEHFCASIQESPVALFEIAAKLRNARLFREALIWVVGQYDQPLHNELSDPKLRMIAGYAHGEIARKVALVANKLLILNTSSEENGGDWLQAIRYEIYGSPWSIDLNTDRLDDFSTIYFPQYFRHVSLASALPIIPELTELLYNKLTLHGANLRSGESKMEDIFLCATIPDEFLPWDPKEVDW